MTTSTKRLWPSRRMANASMGGSIVAQANSPAALVKKARFCGPFLASLLRCWGSIPTSASTGGFEAGSERVLVRPGFVLHASRGRPRAHLVVDRDEPGVVHHG